MLLSVATTIFPIALANDAPNKINIPANSLNELPIINCFSSEIRITPNIPEKIKIAFFIYNLSFFRIICAAIAVIRGVDPVTIAPVEPETKFIPQKNREYKRKVWKRLTNNIDFMLERIDLK